METNEPSSVARETTKKTKRTFWETRIKPRTSTTTTSKERQKSAKTIERTKRAEVTKWMPKARTDSGGLDEMLLE